MSSSVLKERSRACGKMTEAMYRAYIISALRGKSLMWIPVNKTKSQARVSRGAYKCNICGRVIKLKDGVVDHITPIVPVTGWDGWDGFIERLFCETDNLQFICNDCHKEKTDKENKERKLNLKLKKQ